MNTKTCPRCKVEKPLADFGRNKARPDGVEVYCKPCRKERYQLNRAEHLEKEKRYYEQNKDRIRALQGEYYQQNRDRIVSWNKDYREANREDIRAREKARYPQIKEARAANNLRYRTKNKEHVQARQAEYVKNNRLIFLAAGAQRRAAKMKATPTWADTGAIQRVYEKRVEWSARLGVALHVDHVIPLKSKLVCGLHVPANLQLLSAEENIRKLNRHWPDMP